MAFGNLTFVEVSKAWVLRACGYRVRDIQARFDVDPRRLYEAWEEVEHKGSRYRGMRIFARLFPNISPSGRFERHQPRFQRTLKRPVAQERLPGI